MAQKTGQAAAALPGIRSLIRHKGPRRRLVSDSLVGSVNSDSVRRGDQPCRHTDSEQLIRCRVDSAERLQREWLRDLCLKDHILRRISRVV